MVEFRNGQIVSNSPGDIPDGFYYTQKELAEILDVPETTVRVWVKRGIITCVHYYGHTYIPVDASFHYVRPWMRTLRSNSLNENGVRRN